MQDSDFKVGTLIEYEWGSDVDLPRWDYETDNGASGRTFVSQVIAIDIKYTYGPSFLITLPDNEYWYFPLPSNSSFYHDKMYRIVGFKTKRPKGKLVLKSDGRGGVYTSLEMIE